MKGKKLFDKKVDKKQDYEVYDEDKGDLPVTLKLRHKVKCHYCQKFQSISGIYIHMKCCAVGDFLALKKQNKISKEKFRLKKSK